jgi:ATP phosphoribosyltransferase
LVSSQHVFDLAAALADSGIGPVSITRPDYVFEADCPAADALATRVLND